jgi:hypothetical protein
MVRHTYCKAFRHLNELSEWLKHLKLCKRHPELSEWLKHLKLCKRHPVATCAGRGTMYRKAAIPHGSCDREHTDMKTTAMSQYQVKYNSQQRNEVSSLDIYFFLISLSGYETESTWYVSLGNPPPPNVLTSYLPISLLPSYPKLLL